jgi:ornithine--oxo-acid transaminase
MNTGVEAVETAVKIMRRWGYRSKGIPDNEAVILFPTDNFWGRTIAARTTSDNPLMTNGFGPFTRGFEQYEYNNPDALEKKF